jgi:hypothetical protein
LRFHRGMTQWGPSVLVTRIYSPSGAPMYFHEWDSQGIPQKWSPIGPPQCVPNGCPPMNFLKRISPRAFHQWVPTCPPMGLRNFFTHIWPPKLCPPLGPPMCHPNGSHEGVPPGGSSQRCFQTHFPKPGPQLDFPRGPLVLSPKRSQKVCPPRGPKLWVPQWVLPIWSPKCVPTS